MSVFSLIKLYYYLVITALLILLTLDNTTLTSAKEAPTMQYAGCSALALSFVSHMVGDKIPDQAKFYVSVGEDLYNKWMSFVPQKEFNGASVLHGDIYTRNFYRNATELYKHFGYYGLKMLNNAVIDRAFELYNATKDGKALGMTIAGEIELQRQQLSDEIARCNLLQAIYSFGKDIMEMRNILSGSEKFRAENVEELKQLDRRINMAETRRLLFLEKLDSHPDETPNYSRLFSEYDNLEMQINDMLYKVKGAIKSMEAQNAHHEDDFMFAVGESIWTLFRAWMDPYSAAGKALETLAEKKTLEAVKEVVVSREGITAALHAANAVVHGTGYYFTVQELKRLDELTLSIAALWEKLSNQIQDLERDAKLYKNRLRIVSSRR